MKKTRKKTDKGEIKLVSERQEVLHRRLSSCDATAVACFALSIAVIVSYQRRYWFDRRSRYSI